MNLDEKYIKRCLQLARNGFGNTYPNPMVGCVIVYEGMIIGEGWHYKAGEPHAEVNAINSVKEKQLLKKATLYVSLEPCNHVGKTPACSNLILSVGIPKVIVGCEDPNEKVAGQGIMKLRDNNCKVKVGVLEKECKDLNKRFFTYHTKNRPYIILKWAETRDGYLSPSFRKEIKPVWITNEYSRQIVHKWRAEEQAILVGTTTAVVDNPKLDVRHWAGKNPIRIVLDRDLKIPMDYHLCDSSVKTLILTEKQETTKSKMLLFEEMDFSKELAKQICSLLYRYKIQSVIIEGGSKTLQTFIDGDLWDEARVFDGNISFKNGVKAPYLSGDVISSESIQDDTLRVLKNTN